MDHFQHIYIPLSYIMTKHHYPLLTYKASRLEVQSLKVSLHCVYLRKLLNLMPQPYSCGAHELRNFDCQGGRLCQELRIEGKARKDGIKVESLDPS